MSKSIFSFVKEKHMNQKSGIEKVKTYLHQFGLENRVLEFPVSSATVALAAQALNCINGRIAKTLGFKVNDKPFLIVVAGDCKIDNAKYKQMFGSKAKMLTADEVLQATGFAVGGVCPFAVPEGVEIYLDVSLKRFATVFPACGSSNSAIELTPENLEKYTANSGWIDVCRLILPEQSNSLL